MAKQIPLSFKDTKEENEMYEYIKSKSSPSAFVKDLLRIYMNNESIFNGENKFVRREVQKEESNINGNVLASLKSLIK